MPLFVVTSNGKSDVISLLRKYNLLSFFDDIISAKGCEHGKPYLDVYSYAISLVEEHYHGYCYVAVEDSPNGVMSAYRAGCKVIMIPDLTPVTDKVRPYIFSSFESLLALKIFLGKHL